MEPARQVRVAIVGSGMAGLVTAYLLHRDPRQRYDVKVFESGNTLSLDSASVSIPNAARTSADRIDLPMRAFAGGFYSNLKSMYDHIGTQYHSQPFLFEFAKATPSYAGRSADTSYFVHASNFHQRTARPCTTARVSYLLDVAYLLLCYTWFSICCFLIAPHREETLDHYLRRVWIPQRFVTYYLLPLISSVSTCPHKSLLLFPASDMTEYKRRTHGAPHYTVSNGVKTVQDRLIRGVAYELGAFVQSVKPQEKGVQISWNIAGESDKERRTEYFDRVVIAVAPNIVGQIFEPLRYHMTRIPTTEVESIVHTDRGVLELETPMSKDADSHGTQLIYLRTSTEGSYKTESLHVQNCGAVVTTCPFSPIDPALVIHAAKFTRVLRSPESQKIVNSIFRDTPSAYHHEDKSVPLWKNGDDNVWLAGGWCWDGMVLLEGCVVSAMRIADDFDVEVPWRR